MEINSGIGIENQPINHTRELFKNALMYGLMLAGAMILLDLLVYTFDLTGLGMFFGFLVSIISLGIYIGFFIWAGRTYRNKFYNGFMNYGKAVIFCLVMAIIVALAVSLYKYLFYTFFDPERAMKEAQKAIEMISENNHIPDDKKEEIMQAILDKADTKSIVVSSLISNTVFSIVIGAISALFIRKKEKISDINL